MIKWVWAILCVLAGLGMLLGGLLVPAHLRAVDASVLERAGRSTPTLVERGLALAEQRNLAAARALLQIATDRNFIGRDRLATAVASLAAARVGGVLGSEESLLQRLFVNTAATNAEPITDLLVRQENRAVALEYLRVSQHAGLADLMAARKLTNTVFFPAAGSTSGQAFDAALSVCGLLMEQGKLTPSLSNGIWQAAWQATHSPAPAKPSTAPSPTQPLEEILVDLMSLGQRLNWGELEVFVGQVPDTATLRNLAALSRRAGGKMPILFCAVALSGRPGEVTTFLSSYGEDGFKDLTAALSSGAGGVRALVSRNQRFHQSWLRQHLAGYPVLDSFLLISADYACFMPGVAMGVKWFFYLAAGFLLAAAAHFMRPPVFPLEEPLQVRGFHLARESLFGLGFLAVLLLTNEPFLSQEIQKADFHLHIRFPIVGAAAPAAMANPTTSNMNNNNASLLTLLLFFVIQGLIYTTCLLKLAEIRRQRVPARIKLKLLENEDHLFDAGLYVGFAGTIISLILISQHFIQQQSLMAAYSSTSFGIIFVVVFKIFNLRPLRRRYLLEAEAPGSVPVGPARTPAVATQS